MREQRRRSGFPKLLPLAAGIPEIPYIRLSKIERGEVVPRADELRRIAMALRIAPAALLVDVDDPSFDVARWAEPFLDGVQPDIREEEFAVLLGAALRQHRASDSELTIAALHRDHGLAAVNLSRLENAQKTFGRWNSTTRDAVLGIFGVADETALRAKIDQLYLSGALDAYLSSVSNPEHRMERTRAHVRELAAELAGTGGDTSPAGILLAQPPLRETAGIGAPSAIHLVCVHGAPLADGLISDDVTGEQVEAPRCAGANSFALRVDRAPLGGGLPAHSVVVVDPDRPPAPGGLAALRERNGWRLLSVGVSRDGRMVGYSVHPEREIPLDECDPARLAAVVSASFP